MFLADGANSILLNLGSSYYKVSIFVRLFVEVYLLFLLLHHRSGKRIWLILLFFLFVFVAGSAAAVTNLYTFEEYHFLSQFRLVNKIVFFFIVLMALSVYFRSEEDQNRLFKIYEILILAQSLVLIISFIFEINLFSAYLTSRELRLERRFGYQGLIPAQNETSAFFQLGFFYFLFKVHYRRKGVIQLLIVTFAGLLTGAKITVLFPIILVWYFIYYMIVQFSTLRGLIHKNFLIIGIAFLFVASIGVWQRDYIISRIEPTITYYLARGRSYEGGVIEALTVPGRRNKVNDFVTDYLANYNIVNYLFGGFDLEVYSTEMDPVDMFARLGIVGAGVFYFLYLGAFIPSNRISLLRLVFVISWIATSAVVGHITYTAINSTYLAILLLFVTSVETQQNQISTSPKTVIAPETI
jgi:hypothetical protein